MSKSIKNKNLLEKEKQNQDDIEMNPSIFNTNQSVSSETKKYLLTSQQSNNINNSSGNVNYQSSLLFSTNNIQNQANNSNVPRNISMNIPINATYNISNLNSSNINYISTNRSKDEKIILKANFEKLLNEKLNKYGLALKQNNFNDILNTLNNGLDIYLKNMLEKLIIISRARNVNLNLYSKLSEKNPVKKIYIDFIFL